MLPLSLSDQGALSYHQAHAWMGKLMGKLALKAAKYESKLILKNWLKTVVKKEGKKVAGAALLALKTLPDDGQFRVTILTALNGGDYKQALAATKQRASALAMAGASSQWQADRQLLAEHPELIGQSLGQSAGDTVEGQFNKRDDRLTCGAHQIDIEYQPEDNSDTYGQHHYTVQESRNVKQLEGRALLQRAMLKSMMRHSSFATVEQAQAAANRYARLACWSGKSRKVMAFLGGISFFVKDKQGYVQNVRSQTHDFMAKASQWVH